MRRLSRTVFRGPAVADAYRAMYEMKNALVESAPWQTDWADAADAHTSCSAVAGARRTAGRARTLVARDPAYAHVELVEGIADERRAALKLPLKSAAGRFWDFQRSALARRTINRFTKRVWATFLSSPPRPADRRHNPPPSRAGAPRVAARGCQGFPRR